MSRDRCGDRTQEVIGSIPFSSTKIADFPTPVATPAFCPWAKRSAFGLNRHNLDGLRPMNRQSEFRGYDGACPSVGEPLAPQRCC